MHLTGNLSITADNAADYADLTSVGGELSIRADASLPALTSVGGQNLPSPEIARARIRAVAEAALQPGALDMSKWHCGTAHCIGGWAVVQAGKEGARLEALHGTATAGAILLGLDAARMFFAPQDRAEAWLREQLA